MTDRRIIDKIEFYVTNVCNLTCENCNRYNNYKFTGTQHWKDYKDDYAFWATKVDIKQVTILGGEPLLNPSIKEWATGISELWPNCPVQILSNGTRLNAVKGLYDILGDKIWLGVSLHNADHIEGFEKQLYDFLEGPVYKKDLKEEEDLPAQFAYRYIDKNNKQVSMYCQDDFINANLIEYAPSQFRFYNSDPEEAHRVCGFARHKNYHFIRGKMYKCGPVALMPEFAQQFTVDLTDEDKNLLNSYIALSPENWDEYSQEFFQNLDNSIPQCKFCPTKFFSKKIAPFSKEFQINT